MSVRLQIPRAGAFTFTRQFIVSGAALDLTGATLVAYLKQSPDDTDAAALASLTITTLVAANGTVTISGTAAQVPLTYSRGTPYFWCARATKDSVTYAPENCQGQVVLTPLDGVLAGVLSDLGVTEILTPEEAATDTFTAGTMLLSMPTITGLGVTTAGATKLSGLTAATLAAYADGVTIRLTLAGGISADYRLVTGLVGTESQWRVACDNSAGRYWQLAANPSKEGTATVWVSTLSKFKQLLESGGSLAIADDADAFVIPD